jgi:hypothetical protein
MTDFPDVKLKALVSFPASIIDGAGIDVAKVNGAFRFDIAYDDFAPPLTTIADPTHSVMLVWNTVSGQYGLAPTSLLLGSGSAFPSNVNPTMDGIAAHGVSLLYSRDDHVHPSDTSKAPLASPVFTGDPQSVTPPPGDADQSIATTAFVAAAVAAGGATPAALTRTNDTNVTLTLAGNPATALLQAASITAGWSGTLAPARGGWGADISAANGVPVFTTGAATFTAIASAAEYAANTAPTKIMTPGASWTAAGLVTLTEVGATATPDFSAGFDFNWTLSAAGRTLANPTNVKVGQKGMIYLVQPAGGSATITTWGTSYKFPGGVKPTLSAAANAIDVISYAVRSSVQIECFFAGGMA